MYSVFLSDVSYVPWKGLIENWLVVQ